MAANLDLGVGHAGHAAEADLARRPRVARLRASTGCSTSRWSCRTPRRRARAAPRARAPAGAGTAASWSTSTVLPRDATQWVAPAPYGSVGSPAAPTTETLLKCVIGHMTDAAGPVGAVSRRAGRPERPFVVSDDCPPSLATIFVLSVGTSLSFSVGRHSSVMWTIRGNMAEVPVIHPRSTMVIDGASVAPTAADHRRDVTSATGPVQSLAYPAP